MLIFFNKKIINKVKESLLRLYGQEKKSLYGRAKGQVAILLVIAIAIALIFYAVILNIGEVGSLKTLIAKAATMAVAQVATGYVSIGQAYYIRGVKGVHSHTIGSVFTGLAALSITGGFFLPAISWLGMSWLSHEPEADEVCGITPVVVAIVAFIIVVVVTVVSWGSGTGPVIAVMACVLAAASVVISIIINAEGDHLFNKMMAGSMSKVQMFRESGVRTGLQAAASDTVVLPDYRDWNMNTYTSAQDETFSRLNYYYYQRMQLAIKSTPDTRPLMNFLQAMENLVYQDIDGFGLVDPVDCLSDPDHPCCSLPFNGRPSECNVCCVSGRIRRGVWSDSNTGRFSTECEVCGVTMETCAANSPYEKFPLVYSTTTERRISLSNKVYQPQTLMNAHYMYDNERNDFFSFSEEMGKDDENKFYMKMCCSINSIQQLELALLGEPDHFRLGDATGYQADYLYEIFDDPYLEQQHGSSWLWHGGQQDVRRGVYPMFWKIADWGVNLAHLSAGSFHHCHWHDSRYSTVDFINCNPDDLPREIPELHLTTDPEELSCHQTGFVDSVEDNLPSGEHPYFGECQVLAPDAVGLKKDYSADGMVLESGVCAPLATCPPIQIACHDFEPGESVTCEELNIGIWKKADDKFCNRNDFNEPTSSSRLYITEVTGWPYEDKCFPCLVILDNGRTYYKDCDCGEVGDLTHVSVDEADITVPLSYPTSDYTIDILDRVRNMAVKIYDYWSHAKSEWIWSGGMVRRISLDFNAWYPEMASFIEVPGCYTEEGHRICVLGDPALGRPDQYYGACYNLCDDESIPGTIPLMLGITDNLIHRFWSWYLHPYVHSNAWCVPPRDPEDAPDAELATFNLIPEDPAFRGSMGAVNECLRWNAFDVYVFETESVPLEAMGNDEKFKACADPDICILNQEYCSGQSRHICPLNQAYCSGQNLQIPRCMFKSFYEDHLNDNFLFALEEEDLNAYLECLTAWEAVVVPDDAPFLSCEECLTGENSTMDLEAGMVLERCNIACGNLPTGDERYGDWPGIRNALLNFIAFEFSWQEEFIEDCSSLIICTDEEGCGEPNRPPCCDEEIGCLCVDCGTEGLPPCCAVPGCEDVPNCGTFGYPYCCTACRYIREFIGSKDVASCNPDTTIGREFYRWVRRAYSLAKGSCFWDPSFEWWAEGYAFEGEYGDGAILNLAGEPFDWEDVLNDGFFGQYGYSHIVGECFREAQNQVDKFAKRASFLSRRIAEIENFINVFTSLEIALQEFLSVADDFITNSVDYYYNFSATSQALPPWVIYAWQSEDDVETGERGAWHIVQVSIISPARHPDMKVTYYDWGATKCYKLDHKRGDVYATVVRADEQLGRSVFFANGIRLWDFKGPTGEVVNWNDADLNSCVDTANSYGIPAEDISGAFIINGEDHRCYSLVNSLLDNYGISDNKHVHYDWNEAEGFVPTFVD